MSGTISPHLHYIFMTRGLVTHRETLLYTMQARLDYKTTATTIHAVTTTLKFRLAGGCAVSLSRDETYTNRRHASPSTTALNCGVALLRQVVLDLWK
jgi:hypothetical protein